MLGSLEGGGGALFNLLFPLLYSLAGAAASVSKVKTAAAINAEYGLAGDAAITDGVISSLGESVVRARLRDAKAKSPAALLAEAAKIKADTTKQKSGAGEFHRVGGGTAAALRGACWGLF